MKLGFSRLGIIFLFNAKRSSQDERGNNNARAIKPKGHAINAVGPHTCHRLIIIRVRLKTPISLLYIDEVA